MTNQEFEKLKQICSLVSVNLTDTDYEQMKEYTLYNLLLDADFVENLENKKIKQGIEKIKLIVQLYAQTNIDGLTVSSPEEVIDFCKLLVKNVNDNYIAVYLGIENRVIGYNVVTEKIIYHRNIAHKALLCNAKSVIVVHKTNIIKEKVMLTERDIKEALETIDVRLIDYITVKDTGEIFSFFENNIL